MSTVIDEVALEDSLEIDPSLLAAFLRSDTAGPIVLAFDLGTSGGRAALFDRRGQEIEGSQTALASDLHSELGTGGDANADALVSFVAQAIDGVCLCASAANLRNKDERYHAETIGR